MGIVNKENALYMATGIDNSGLYSGLKQSEDRINQFEDFVKQSGQRIGLSLGAIFGVEKAKSFVNEIVNVRAEMQLLETSFGVLLGNEAASNKMLAEIKQYAIESPLSLNGVAKAAQLLLGFNVEAEKVMPIIRQLGDISMGSTERFQSLALAFAQMSAAGKLMGQDLLQMINAGFNPLQVMSKQTGKSLMELRVRHHIFANGS
jgi:tape measure domain-containing protein